MIEEQCPDKRATETNIAYDKLTEENEKLKKQLELAINALKKIGSEPYPWYIAGTALEQIEELDR